MASRPSCDKDKKTFADPRLSLGAESMRKIVIVGAGFAGIHATLILQEALETRRKVSLTLINADSHFSFTPLLPNAASGEIEPESISVPLVDLLTPKANLAIDRIARVDLKEGRLSGDATYEFDSILLAPGAEINWGHNGAWRDRTDVFGLAHPRDAIAIRERIQWCFERALDDPSPEHRREFLTFVIAGAGPTGVTLGAEIATTLVEGLLADYPMLQRFVRVILVEPQAEILPDLEKSLRKLVTRSLEREGVQLRLRDRVVDKTDDRVVLQSGGVIKCQSLFWCAGVHPSSLIQTTGLTLDAQGRLPVDDDMRVRGCDREGVYAAGDVAGVGTRPWTADIATDQGRTAAHNILADLSGRKRRKWSYEYRGDILTLGSRNAVATFRGRAFDGRTARTLYRAIYTALVPSSTRKMLVLRDWLAASSRERHKLLPTKDD